MLSSSETDEGRCPDHQEANGATTFVSFLDMPTVLVVAIDRGSLFFLVFLSRLA
jgi:hypothetical protein